MLTDPIADFLTRLRNASHARKNELTVRSSRMAKAISQILTEKRFIGGFEETKMEKISSLCIKLLTDREPLEVKRISKPGQRIYIGYKNLKRVRNGFGIGIISTPQGVISDEAARQKKIGGEYIAEIY